MCIILLKSHQSQWLPWQLLKVNFTYSLLSFVLCFSSIRVQCSTFNLVYPWHYKIQSQEFEVWHKVVLYVWICTPTFSPRHLGINIHVRGQGLKRKWNLFRTSQSYQQNLCSVRVRTHIQTVKHFRAREWGKKIRLRYMEIAGRNYFKSGVSVFQ